MNVGAMECQPKMGADKHLRNKTCLGLNCSSWHHMASVLLRNLFPTLHVIVAMLFVRTWMSTLGLVFLNMCHEAITGIQSYPRFYSEFIHSTSFMKWKAHPKRQSWNLGPIREPINVLRIQMGINTHKQHSKIIQWIHNYCWCTPFFIPSHHQDSQSFFPGYLYRSSPFQLVTWKR